MFKEAVCDKNNKPGKITLSQGPGLGPSAPPDRGPGIKWDVQGWKEGSRGHGGRREEGPKGEYIGLKL